MWKIIRESTQLTVIEKQTYNQVIKTFISYIKRDKIKRDNYVLECPDGKIRKIFDMDYGLL